MTNDTIATRHVRHVKLAPTLTCAGTNLLFQTMCIADDFSCATLHFCKWQFSLRDHGLLIVLDEASNSQEHAQH